MERVAEIAKLDFGALDLGAVVPHRRVVELARYGMAGSAHQLKRHGDSRKLATLLATVVYLEAKAVDDTLELLDLLMVTELVGKAESTGPSGQSSTVRQTFRRSGPRAAGSGRCRNPGSKPPRRSGRRCTTSRSPGHSSKSAS